MDMAHHHPSLTPQEVPKSSERVLVLEEEELRGGGGGGGGEGEKE
jgi:hypothetical protein